MLLSFVLFKETVFINFNLFMTIVDLVCLAGLFLIYKKYNKISFLIFINVGILFFLSLGILAIAIAKSYFVGIFAVLCFLCLGLFIHLPALLLILAVLFRASYKLRNICIIIALLLVGFYGYAFHIEPYWLEVSYYSYSHPLLKDLKKPVVIAQVSDIQAEDISAYEHDVFDKLKQIKPDLIFHTGDYIQLGGEEYIEVCYKFRQLLKKSNLKPKYGSYAIAGNIDHPDFAEALFAGSNVQILQDRRITLTVAGQKINLIGLAMQTSRTYDIKNIQQITQGRDVNCLDIFIGHCPCYAKLLAQDKRPFLAFAGHTHGGQCQIPFLGPIFTLTRVPRQYADSFKKYGPGTLSVARGIGMERGYAPRLRFWCRPELRIVTLMPYIKGNK